MSVGKMRYESESLVCDENEEDALGLVPNLDDIGGSCEQTV